MDWMIEKGYDPVRVTLHKRVEEAPSVKSFYFEYPKNELEYRAGQTFHLHLDFPNDPDWYHVFSIASSPTEKYLIFTMKIRQQSRWKRALDSMKTGEELVVLGPSGSYVLPETASSQVVFLGDGIGISPFRSMAKFAADRGVPHRITLLYCNRTPRDIVYKKLWPELQAMNPNFEVIHVVGNPAESEREWQGRVGEIDHDLLREFVEDLDDALFYVCATPSGVRKLAGVLISMGIRERVKIDTFKGYD
ncbi:MAG: FAD-dependent oxidoreductase [Candidatus Geothermarchaeales archaeon]